MRRAHVALVLAATLCLFSATIAEAAGPVRHRQKKQAARIHQGVKSGSLTPGEAHALRGEQRAINQERRSALADGKMSPGEAKHLRKAQQKASRHISRATHNQKTQQ